MRVNSERSSLFGGEELRGKIIDIMSYGSIGRQVVRLPKPLGCMDCLYIEVPKIAIAVSCSSASATSRAQPEPKRVYLFITKSETYTITHSKPTFGMLAM